MLYLGIGLLLAGLYLGRAWALGPKRLAAWRPGVGLAAIASAVGALVLAVRGAWPEGLGLLALALLLALSARRRATDRSRAEPATVQRRMGVDEAAAMLGVAADAPAEIVQAAYVRLMLRVHPDRGGASGLATQLNLARETLLDRRTG